MAQVPPPPQAEGKNILFPPRVESIVSPALTSKVFSPLMVSLTNPEEVSFALAYKITINNANKKIKKTTMLAAMVIPKDGDSKIIF
jgi:uncharacterized protein affecting Mg2+/Co2+ transport